MIKEKKNVFNTYSENMKKNILITGGAGSIGKYLVNIFCKSNKYNIYVIDKKRKPIYIQKSNLFT